MSIGALNKIVLQPASYADGPRLLADIGGTHARFALEQSPGEIEGVRVYHCVDFPGVLEALRCYIADMALTHINHAALAIANPVAGDWIQMTNRQWSFSIEATRQALGFQTLLVVNDFTALAMALPGLNATQRCPIGSEASLPCPNAVIGLLGSGTGLGVSGLVPAGGRWVALQSEGGHASFAPSDAREDFILSYARRFWSHVSWERVACGAGIALIYAALAARAAVPRPADQTLEVAAVVERALSGDALACEALDCFCGILGACAGNLAVTLGATGGIYVGGGVVLRFRDFFLQSSFRQRFEAKGRFERYLKPIPTYLITAEQPALSGVAALLADRLAPPPHPCVSVL